MSQSLNGFFTDDLTDLLSISRGMAALEREMRRDSGCPHPNAQEIRARVTELLIGTKARRGAEPAEPVSGVGATSGRTFMDVSKAAEMLNKTKEMVRRDCRAGRLFAEKAGKSWRITSDSVERLRKGAA
jgi:Helix-turn-helix domain